MPLTELGEQELIDLQWENMVLKNAIVKHFLNVDLDKRPSQRVYGKVKDDDEGVY